MQCFGDIFQQLLLTYLQNKRHLTLHITPVNAPHASKMAAHVPADQNAPPRTCLCFSVTGAGHLASPLPARAGARAPRRVSTGPIRCSGATMSEASPADKSARPDADGVRPPLCHGWEQQLSGDTLTGRDKLPYTTLRRGVHPSVLLT